MAFLAKYWIMQIIAQWVPDSNLARFLLTCSWFVETDQNIHQVSSLVAISCEKI